ncbi:MAG: hypothetical protein U0838_10160 [Chloroflexota bacterium]
MVLASHAARTAAIVQPRLQGQQIEMEAAARLLREGGVPLIDPDRGAELVIVNTSPSVHGGREEPPGGAPSPSRQPRRPRHRDGLLGPGGPRDLRAGRSGGDACGQRHESRLPG